MSSLALLFLLLTSLAPIGLVYAAVLADGCEYVMAAWFGGISLVLLPICWVLLSGAHRWLNPVPKSITETATKEGESLSFLVAYALPIVALKAASTAVSYGLIAFTVIMGAAIWQQQVFHMNPLLILFGYHFFGARNDAGAQVLVLTKNKLLKPGDLRVIRLSDYLWLDCSEPGEVADELSAGDNQRPQSARGAAREGDSG